MRSLLPEVKLGETSDKLTSDELNLLLAHAHRKVLHLQTQLARLQVLEGRFRGGDVGKLSDERMVRKEGNSVNVV